MTKLLALELNLPGSGDQHITIPGVGGNSAVTDPTLGGFLSPLLNVVFFIASFLMFSWMVWGIFQYIFAGGNKEGLAKARSRITWAIVGFCIVLLAFTISKFAREIFPPNDVHVDNGGIQNVSEPPPLK